MPDEQTDSQAASEPKVRSSEWLAVPPLHINGAGLVIDATGSTVLACSEKTDCPLRFSEREVNKDGHFMCPNCGRLGQRMIEASPEQCGFTMTASDRAMRPERITTISPPAESSAADQRTEGSHQRIVGGIIIPERPPASIVEALNNFVRAVYAYEETGVWPDNGTIRRLAEEGREALGHRYSPNS